MRNPRVIIVFVLFGVLRASTVLGQIDEQRLVALDSDWIQQTKGVDPKTGQTTVTVTKLDGSQVVRVVNLPANSDWTSKTRVLDNQRGKITLTVFRTDGTHSISELDTRTNRVTESHVDVDGVTTIRQVDPTTGIESETKLYADGTQILTETTRATGKQRVSIARPDGTGEFRDVDLVTKFANVTRFHPNGSQEIIATHPVYGFENVTWIRPNGAQEIHGISPETGARTSLYLFPNGTQERYEFDDRIEEKYIDLLDPLWTRKVKKVDSTTGTVTLTVFSADGGQVDRSVRGPCKLAAFGDCNWIETTRQIDQANAIETTVQYYPDGTKKVVAFQRETQVWNVKDYDKNGQVIGESGVGASNDQTKNLFTKRRWNS